MGLPAAVRRYLTATARKGGNARAKQLSPARRRDIAKKAAQARWRRPRARERVDR